MDPGNGYRYYESARVPAAQVIRRLRDLGMPVAEVKAVLCADDLDSRSKVIAAHFKVPTQGMGSKVRLFRPEWRRLGTLPLHQSAANRNVICVSAGLLHQAWGAVRSVPHLENSLIVGTRQPMRRIRTPR